MAVKLWTSRKLKGSVTGTERQGVRLRAVELKNDYEAEIVGGGFIEGFLLEYI